MSKTVGWADLAAELKEPPAWVNPAALRLALRVEDLTPAGSTLERLRPNEYSTLRREWAAQLRQAAGSAGAPLQRFGLVVIRRGATLLRWDSAIAGLKPILQVLVARDAQHPDAIGLVVDDMPLGAMPHAPVLVQVPTVRGHEASEFYFFAL